jgi:hypothetical protein
MNRKKKGMLRQQFTGREFAPYARAIGQAGLAWNDLHERLGLLFESILGMPDHMVALAVWHSSIQDRACREMLKSILYEVPLRWPVGFPRAGDDIAWILDRAQSLEDARNDMIHAPLILLGHRGAEHAAGYLAAVYSPRIVAQEFLGHKRAAKLSGKDLLAEFRWCRDTALLLRDFTVDVTIALGAVSKPSPWPGRPVLPTRVQKTNRPNLLLPQSLRPPRRQPRP